MSQLQGLPFPDFPDSQCEACLCHCYVSVGSRYPDGGSRDAFREFQVELFSFDRRGPDFRTPGTPGSGHGFYSGDPPGAGARVHVQVMGHRSTESLDRHRLL